MSHSCASTLCITPHYEEGELPKITEMECPIDEPLQMVPECSLLMGRSELAVHITQFHKEYEADPDPYFEAEQERRYA